MHELTFLHGFMRQVERDAARTLVIDDAAGYRADYGDHLARVLRLASALPGLGVQPDDRFAVLAGNGHRYLELWHAAFLGAGVITPLNVRLVAPELAFVLRDAGVEVCFVDASCAGIVEEIVHQTGLRAIVALDQSTAVSTHSYEELIRAGEERSGNPIDEDRMTALMYTGGTTGRAKGVMLSGRAQLLNQYHILMTAPVPEGWRFLQHAPMFHAGTAGGVLRTPLTGGTVVMLPSFEPQGFMAAIDTHQVQHTVLVPSMISRLLAHPAFRPERLRSLRRVHYGGSAISPELLRSLRSLYPGLELVQSYGMTEASSNVTQLGDAEHRGDDRYLKSAGRALPGVRLQIRAADGRRCGPGEVGEICLRGGNLMSGYWNRPEETAEALRDGWYHTGDLGRVDSDGYLFVVDRLKDMIISGGENVYSAEVEQALLSHPAVAEAAVVGVPDPTWGEMVVAFVVLRQDAVASEAELIAHARGVIAGYKVPKRIEQRTGPLPVSATGKVLKRELREHARLGRGETG